METISKPAPAGADRASYEEHGFLVIENLLDARTVTAMRDAIDEIVRSAANLGEIAELEPSDPAIMRRIWAPAQKHATFRAVQDDPRIVDRVERLIGPNVMFHHSKLNVKGPRVGSPVEWHQDMAYYPHTNPNLVAVLVYIDDASEDNGCLRVLDGSHRGPVYEHTDEHGYFRGKVDPARVPAGLREVCAAGAAGTAVFLHCKLLHRSGPNRSDRYRRVFIPAYRAADALPIYFGPHAAHNEQGTYLLRGEQVRYVSSDAARYPLPIAEKAFNSLFALQQGEHVSAGLHAKTSGYATDVPPPG